MLPYWGFEGMCPGCDSGLGVCVVLSDVSLLGLRVEFHLVLQGWLSLLVLIAVSPRVGSDGCVFVLIPRGMITLGSEGRTPSLGLRGMLPSWVRTCVPVLV